MVLIFVSIIIVLLVALALIGPRLYAYIEHQQAELKRKRYEQEQFINRVNKERGVINAL